MSVLFYNLSSFFTTNKQIQQSNIQREWSSQKTWQCIWAEKQMYTGLLALTRCWCNNTCQSSPTSLGLANAIFILFFFLSVMREKSRGSCDCHRRAKLVWKAHFFVCHVKKEAETAVITIAGPSGAGGCADRHLSALYIQNTRKLSADWKCRKLWDWENKQQMNSISFSFETMKPKKS